MNATLSSTLTGAAADFATLPLTFTRELVAELAHCHVRTVEREEAAGNLPALRPSRGGSQRTLYARADVLRWLGIELHAPTPAPRRRGRSRKASIATEAPRT